MHVITRAYQVKPDRLGEFEESYSEVGKFEANLRESSTWLIAGGGISGLVLLFIR